MEGYKDHRPNYPGVYQSGDNSTTNIGELNVGSTNFHTRLGATHGAGPGSPAPVRRVDVGVIAVLPEEMRAVARVLERAHSYRASPLDSGAQAHEADIPIVGGVLRTVAVQALDPGPRSAVVAYHQLRKDYQPPIVLLVGIAGAVNDDVAIGDVVISDEVIYYDARRETAEGVIRRGQDHRMAPVLRHRLNDFFRVHGEVLKDRSGVRFKVHRGPVGSGDAVITNEDSDIRRWLQQFHEWTLAVETEAAGVAQAFYEEVEQDTPRRGWLTIRGISDRADHRKRWEYHELAADRAADVFERLLPFLLLPPMTT